MAARKRSDDLFYAINEHGTVVLTDQELFNRQWEPAGYRRLGEDEPAPIQAHEMQDHNGDVLAILAARRDEHGHERYPLPIE